MNKLMIALAATGGLGLATPAMAASTTSDMPNAVQSLATLGASTLVLEQSSDYRGRKYRRGYRDGYRDARRDDYYGGPVWRGRDGRYYCRRDNGTTGLLIGGAVGGLIGNEVAGRGDKLLGTILGAAGGALLGREIDKSRGFKCR